MLAVSLMRRCGFHDGGRGPVDLAAVVNGLTLTTALPSRPMREGPGRGEGDTLSIGVLSARSAKEDR
jgi:hypothetical protein